MAGPKTIRIRQQTRRALSGLAARPPLARAHARLLFSARRVAGARQLGQLVRLAPVLALVREVGGGRLLDVGSGALGVADFLDGAWEVTALDRSFDDYGAWEGPPRTRARRVQGDARALPFGDASFDVVVAVDVLEHVPAHDRSLVLSELARVAAQRVVVAAPAGTAAEDGDRRLAGLLRQAPPWLDEHLQIGLPDPEELAGPLRAHGALRTFGNETVDAHVALTRRELSIAWFLPTRLAARALASGLRTGASWPEPLLARIRGGDRRPCYRTVVVLEIAASESSPSSAVT